MTTPLSSVQGLITGFNSRDLVDAIIAQARIPAERMEANIVALQQKTTALGNYRGLLDTVRNAARTLRTGSAFDATAATTTVLSGTRALATATTTAAATPGTFTLAVNTLARAEKLAGTGQADFATALGMDGTFSINGQDVVVTTADSMVAIRDKGTLPCGVVNWIRPNPSIVREDSGSRMTKAKRRPPSTICAAFSPSIKPCSMARICGVGTPYCAAAA